MQSESHIKQMKSAVNDGHKLEVTDTCFDDKETRQKADTALNAWRPGYADDWHRLDLVPVEGLSGTKGLVGRPCQEDPNVSPVCPVCLALRVRTHTMLLYTCAT